MAWYKIHYDMLRQLEPHLDEDDEKTATISNAELYYDWEEPHLDAYPMEGDFWETSLAKELIVKEDVNATWAEIAACCLWHTSFYGFTQAQIDKTFENLNFYDANLLDPDITKIRAKRAKEIVESKGIHVPSVKEMLKVPAFKNEIRRRIARVRRVRSHFSRRNWRGIKRRVIHNKYWERVLDLCEVIKEFKVEEYAISKETIREAFDANRFETYKYESYTDEGSNRVGWFKELIEKYEAFKRGFYHNAIFCFSVSSEHEPTMEEMNSINEIICLYDNSYTLFWDINYDESLGSRMRMTVISYE